MLLAALLAALLGLWGAATTCGEGCQQPGFGWIDEPDAWQWRVQAVVACLGVLPAGALVVAALSGDRARARASFALTAIVYGVWTIGFFPGLLILLLAAVVGAGALMSPLLAAPRAPATRVRSRMRRARVVLGVVLVLLAALFTALFSLVVASLACGEDCAGARYGWQENPDAWQWRAQAVLACLGVVPAGALLIAGMTSHRALARESFALIAIVYGIWSGIGSFWAGILFFLVAIMVAGTLISPLLVEPLGDPARPRGGFMNE